MLGLVRFFCFLRWSHGFSFLVCPYGELHWFSSIKNQLAFKEINPTLSCCIFLLIQMFTFIISYNFVTTLCSINVVIFPISHKIMLRQGWFCPWIESVRTWIALRCWSPAKPKNLHPRVEMLTRVSLVSVHLHGWLWLNRVTVLYMGKGIFKTILIGF